MGVQGWKKIIAIFVVIAFIGVGVAWAIEQGTPQFQEKAGTPVVKKHKKFPWLIVALGAAAVGVGVYFLTKKNDSGTDATITLSGRNVEYSDEVVGGDITFKLGNGKTVSGSVNSSLVLEGSNRIVDASVSGQGNYFPNDLIFRDADTGELLGKKDAKGFTPFTVKDGQKIKVEYIKQGFDIELFKRCLDLSGTNPVIKRYDKTSVNVGIMNGGIEPSATDIKNLTDFIEKYNTILDGKMRLNYVGKVTAVLIDGVTYGIGDVFASHNEIVVSNVITRSDLISKSNLDLSTVLEEGDGASSARGDGGNPNNPYVNHSANDFTAEGKRVIHLHYCLPPGYAPNGAL